MNRKDIILFPPILYHLLLVSLWYEPCSTGFNKCTIIFCLWLVRDCSNTALRWLLIYPSVQYFFRYIPGYRVSWQQVNHGSLHPSWIMDLSTPAGIISDQLCTQLPLMVWCDFERKAYSSIIPHSLILFERILPKFIVKHLPYFFF